MPLASRVHTPGVCRTSAGKLADATRTHGAGLRMPMSGFVKSTRGSGHRWASRMAGLASIALLAYLLLRPHGGDPHSPGADHLLPEPQSGRATESHEVGLPERVAAEVGRRIRLLVESEETGQPIASASVRLAGRRSRLVPDGDGQLLGITGPDGAVACIVPADEPGAGGQILLRVEAGGFASEVVLVHAAADATTVRLLTTRALPIRFVDRDGVGVPGVYALASAAPFDVTAAVFRSRVQGRAHGRDPRAIFAAVSDAAGMVRLEHPAGTRLHVYCEHPGYVALDQDWSLGGVVEVPASGCVVAMVRLSVAAALVPRDRMIRCRWEERDDDLPRELRDVVGVRKRALAKLLQGPDRVAALLVRLDAAAPRAAAATLQVTKLDGSESRAAVPFRPVAEVMRDGALAVDLDEAPPERIARVAVEMRTAAGERLVGVPYRVFRVSPTPEDSGGSRAALAMRMDSLQGLSGDGPRPIVPGHYRASVAGQVGAQAQSSTVACEAGRTTTLEVVLDPLAPCRVSVRGPEAEYVGGLVYSVHDALGRSIASYVGSVDVDAQVWLPSGSYTVEVQLFALGRHSVPLVVRASDGQRTVEVFVEPPK